MQDRMKKAECINKLVFIRESLRNDQNASNRRAVKAE